MEGQLQMFLTCDLDGGNRSVSHSVCYTPEKWHQLNRKWGRPIAGLYAFEDWSKTIPCPWWESNNAFYGVRHVAYSPNRLTYSSSRLVPSDIIWFKKQFLGAFAKLWKTTISFVMSVCPSVHMEQLGSHWTDFVFVSQNLSKNSSFAIIWQE